MKRLRRKKSSDNISSSRNSPSDRKGVGSAGNGVYDPTPLYSRFATSRRDDSSTVKPLVSGPIMLTPKSSGNISRGPAAEHSPVTPRKPLRRIPSSSISPSHDYASSGPHISKPKSRTHITTSTRADSDVDAARSPPLKASGLLDSDVVTRPPTRPREEETYNASPIISAMMLQAIITTPEPQQHIPLPQPHSQHARHDAFPTPPPSTVSSVQAPARTSQKQVPAVDRRDTLPPDATTPPAKVTLTSTQNAPIRRRKYSLLAAFGPPPSSISVTESNVSRSDSAEQNSQPPSNVAVPAPESTLPKKLGPPAQTSSSLERDMLAHQTMSPTQANAQLRTPRSDMMPLGDEPNNYASTPLASTAPLPIPSSSSTRRDPNISSSAPSSSTVPQGSDLGQSLAISELSDLQKVSKSPHVLPSSLSEPTSERVHASHRSRKTHKSHSQDAGNNAEQHERRHARSNSNSQHPKDNVDGGTSRHGHPAGPVRGQPLIFAAMASAEAESFVPFVEDLPLEEPQPVVHRTPSTSRKDSHDQSQDYPSPRSPSPPLHQGRNGDRRRAASATSNDADSDGEKIRQSPLSSRMRTLSLPEEEPRIKKEREPEHANRSQKHSETSTETRAAGRLGTTHTTTQFIDEVPSEAKPVPVEDPSLPAQPQQASLVRPEPPSLGSPIHLPHGRSLSESRSADAVSPLRSRSSHRERDRETSRSKRRSRDGIKLLTEKQLERLNSRAANANAGTNAHAHGHSRRDEETGLRSPRAIKAIPPVEPPTPISPDDLHKGRSKRSRHRPERSRQQTAAEIEEAPSGEQREPTFYPFAKHLIEPTLLGALLPYVSFSEWCALSSISKETRKKLHDERALSEIVLERYLGTVGYARWTWSEPEPLVLSLTDLNAYMRGVSMPTHQYAQLAKTYAYSSNPAHSAILHHLSESCRAYTRVVLRLRAQAEAVAAYAARHPPPPESASVLYSPPRGTSPAASYRSQSGWPTSPSRVNVSRTSSRAPSPSSSITHSRPKHTPSRSVDQQRDGPHIPTFRSPLFRPRRAPLLQVFVPSPESDWLSDAGVLDCEQELKRAGVLHLLRAGDVVWDTAVGDEGNVGRLVWDGSYLIDLDYTYSRTGDLPQYLPTLAFPPSYFHRVIRTMGSGNPICHIDISPWAEEIATNLQLLQDRMKTETPQGGYHTVVRWVHRSSFSIRPPAGAKSIRIPVPKNIGPGPSSTGAWVVDPGWYGTVVVEAEGTNEGRADLQSRCQSAFPPRAVGAYPNPEGSPKNTTKTVFRILRERSRPSEIWIRTVREKERLLPP